MAKVYIVRSEGGVEKVFSDRRPAEAFAQALEDESRAYLNNGNCYDFWVEEKDFHKGDFVGRRPRHPPATKACGCAFDDGDEDEVGLVSTIS